MNDVTPSMQVLLQIMSQLRDPKDGCPWDRKQSFESIVPHTIEETYEVVDAIHKQDWTNLQEELGDLLFQIVFYAQLASEQKLFDFNDVVETLNEKLMRRHPHVFQQDPDVDLDRESEQEMEQRLAEQWQALKQQEKTEQGKVEKSILDSVSESLPALSKAYKIQHKCAQVGFDWDDIVPVAAKVNEEVDEVLAELKHPSVDQDNVEMELGDLLFATVNLVRHLNCHPEVALNKANLKFSNRFKAVEAKVTAQNLNMEECDLVFLDRLWDAVKKDEKSFK